MDLWYESHSYSNATSQLSNKRIPTPSPILKGGQTPPLPAWSIWNLNEEEVLLSLGSITLLIRKPRKNKNKSPQEGLKKVRPIMDNHLSKQKSLEIQDPQRVQAKICRQQKERLKPLPKWLFDGRLCTNEYLEAFPQSSEAKLSHRWKSGKEVS